MKTASVPNIDLSQITIPPSLISLLPRELMQRYGVVPFDMQEGRLALAMVEPWNQAARQAIQILTGCQLDVFAAAAASITKVLAQAYTNSDALPFSAELNVDKTDDEAPVVRAVDRLFVLAARHRASDVHLEPQSMGLFVRFRVDGTLRTIHMFSRSIMPAIIARIKVLAGLDITEKRLPQDGQFRIDNGGREVDLRISTLPAKYGEKMVIRLLDKATAAVDLGELGMPPALQSQFETMIDKPQGLILVTGPTGSGKTTSLYAVIKRLRSPMKNIITLENPVEYELMAQSSDESGVTQVQINPKIGLTFASGLRSCLRQDPDVIMVGEIRDKETAEVAMQASMTGHLVLSTIHTNSAPETLGRLRDIGVDQWLVATTLTTVVAQRLLRVLCPQCKQAYEPPQRLLEALFPGHDLKDTQTLYRPKGCEICQGSGYYGRKGVFEVMLISDTLREAIQAHQPFEAIRRIALDQGMRTLRQGGMALVYEGITSTEEVFRNTVL